MNKNLSCFYNFTVASYRTLHVPTTLEVNLFYALTLHFNIPIGSHALTSTADRNALIKEGTRPI